MHFVFPQEICRHLRPNSLRAKYGIDKIRNGVHCTDLPEDGVLEVGDVYGTGLVHDLVSGAPGIL